MSDFIIENGVLMKCNSNENHIDIPDGVTKIDGNWFTHTFTFGVNMQSIMIPGSVTEIASHAFDGCTNLRSIMIPDSVMSTHWTAFEKTACFMDESNWDSGILYIGNCLVKAKSDKICNDVVVREGTKLIAGGAFDGCRSLQTIQLPEGLKAIGSVAFRGCDNLKSLTLPSSVTSLGEECFAGCTQLQSFTVKGTVKITHTTFGWKFPMVKDTKTLYPMMTDAAIKRYLLLSAMAWEKIDPEVRHEIFMMRQGKSLLSEYSQYIQDFDDLGQALLTALEGKPATKVFTAVANYMVLFAKEASSATLQALYAALKSAKGAAKALATVEKEPIVMECLGKQFDVGEKLPAAEKAISKKHARHTLQETMQKAYSIKPSDLPKLSYKNGKAADAVVWMYLLTAHECVAGDVCADWEKPGLCPEAAAIVAELDAARLQKCLLALAKAFLGLKGNNKKMYLAYPICRYADETTMKELTKVAPSWRSTVSGNNAPSLYTFRQAVRYSDTRAAMLFADKYKELDAYARLRGTDADTLRDRYMSDVGLDEQGGKTYDLGNQVVIARLQSDLTFLFELTGGKTAKSLPKKGADAKLYEAASADFSEMKKSVRQIVKNRKDVLFEDFLGDKSRKAKDWREAYLQNPLLRSVARLLVWEQDGVTFTVNENGAITVDGAVFTMSDSPVKLAHPMTMDKTDLTAWQKYFTANALKQPFEQVWEPVIDPSSVKPDRYKGCMIPYYRFTDQKKRGITVRDYDFHNQINISVRGCNTTINRIDWVRHAINPSDRFEIESFSFCKFDRKINHVVAYFDRVTVYGRIAKDDVTIALLLPQFTLAQIMDFIKVAGENNATAVMALLMDHKARAFPDFDPMDEFTLD